MTAEAIARVVGDLKARRVLPSVEHEIFRMSLALVQDPIVVDATGIYEALVERSEGISIYEDHPCIAPPWSDAIVGYVNQHGNVTLMHISVDEPDDVQASMDLTGWEPALPIDTDRVRWIMNIFVWIGGRGSRGERQPIGPVPTHGPRHLWQFAVYDDGYPADLHWVHLVPNYLQEKWDMAHLVVLGALNFMNCVNVSLVNPVRPRAQARRLARTGIKVHTINVFPFSKSTRAAKAEGGVGVPVTPVRGHFAKYGPEYGRGLLFGKYAGRFWIPQHARGDPALGRSEPDYKLEPNAPAHRGEPTGQN